ncbi:MAG: hypothetical protein F4Y45_15385 [Acidobacteria bacterium]|nr:hypothetical protein [Acidobacteriota bacterium]MYJ02872.1 hypothetical protein [Acidobacteriota bacterium]
MAKTRKVQVTLDETQYESLLRASRGRKLAAVVREAVAKYCVEPDTQHRRLEAIDKLYLLDPVPAPKNWAEWKREYGRLKTRFGAADAGADDERR